MIGDQTRKLSAIETPASIADHTGSHMVKMYGREPDSIIADCEEELCRAVFANKSQYKEIQQRKGKCSSTRNGRKRGKVQQFLAKTLIKTKQDAENNASVPIKTVRKPGRDHWNVRGSLNTGTTTRKTNVHLSVTTTDQFAPTSTKRIMKYENENNRNIGYKKKTHVDADVSQTKTARNNRTENLTRTKLSIRQLKGSAMLRSRLRGTSVPVDLDGKELMGDKAENNNWMTDSQEAADVQNGIVVPTFHNKSRASSFSTFIHPNSVSKTIVRASSGDDSFIQTAYSPGPEKRNGHSDSGLYGTTRPVGTKTILRRMSRSPGQCSDCKNESLGHKCGRCSTCNGRSKQDGILSGPLDELKAYAQSIAKSVKKILLLSPGAEQSEEIIDVLAPTIDTDECIEIAPQTEDKHVVRVLNNPLHRYRTEINLTNIPEARSKTVLNKSVSYDGRVGSSLDEKIGRSPMYWISPDKFQVPETLSKLSDSTVYADGDYFTDEKDVEIFQDSDSDHKGKISRLEKVKTKISIKQLARVERARTDGDLRPNPLQQSIPNKKIGKDEHKKGYEFHRNRSKTFHEADLDADEFCEYYQKQEEERDSSGDINICREKVIHEGSPVDPPYNYENNKCQDNKGHKAVIIRCATAPFKNHVSKKDIVIGDKVNAMEAAARASRLNAKIAVRTNKASTLRKENSLNDKKKVQEVLEPQPDNWIPDSSETTVSSTRRRSTSFDGSHQLYPKQGQLHRSISWSFVEGDDEGSKQRRAAASVSNISIKRQKQIDDKFTVNIPSSSQCLLLARNEHKSRNVLSTDLFLQEPSTDTFRYYERESSNDKMTSNISKNTPPNVMEHLEMMQSSSKSSYFNKMRYSHEVGKQLAPCIEENVFADHHPDTVFDTESYYCYTDNLKASNQLGDNMLKTDQFGLDSYSESIESESVYLDESNKYGESATLLGKNSPWYSLLQESLSDHGLRRDRSLDSKSSNSFHLVNTAKNSRSDEALTKYSEGWEHAASRKQSMYTETDVDTGVIYHLAKRQTTRMYVPPYPNLMSTSRDIYTMSGDVSMSLSSNSAISTRSEVSECPYTGGFYTEDPFYYKDTKRSISEESTGQIYFQPDGLSKRIPSDLDIYTGSIFNSKQNALSLSNVAGPNKSGAHMDGSTNNSTRSSMVKTQRSLKCRPRIDAITDRNDSAWGYLFRPILASGENQFYDMSNNSNNWGGVDDFDDAFNQGSIVTKSKEPLYTDYDPGMRPEFHVRNIEKTEPEFDFLKYDGSNEANTTFFSVPQRDNSSGDSMWYSGLLNGQPNDSFEKRYPRANQSPEASIFSWQYSDDYYTSTVRPRVGKTNKYGFGKQGNITQDTNNNHFDDIYTGSYGADNVQPHVQEQAGNSRQAVSDNWDVKQPTPKLTSSTFYDQGFESVYTMSDNAKKSASAIYESAKASRSSASVFGPQNSSFSESTTYMADDGWRKYEQGHRQTTNTFDEPKKHTSVPVEKFSHEETDSYFNYVSNKSPDRGFYLTDDDTYSFESKVVKETPHAPVVPEIKTVGGIVCRENVANKEDYAEDINRDLEPGTWMPFSFRREDEVKHVTETSNDSRSEAMRTSETIGHGQMGKHFEDTSYAHNRLYGNDGARNKWREMAITKEKEPVRGRDTSQHRAYQSGDTGKQDHAKSARHASDVIPAKARGKRACSPTTKNQKASTTTKSSGSKSNCTRHQRLEAQIL